VVFMLVAGVVVDRLPRRAVMIASDLVRMAVLAYLAVASLGGSLRIGSLTAAAAVYGAADAFFWPAKTAILPELVVRDHLMPAKRLAHDRNVRPDRLRDPVVLVMRKPL
jgi:MFS family permease